MVADIPPGLEIVVLEVLTQDDIRVGAAAPWTKTLGCDRGKSPLAIAASVRLDLIATILSASKAEEG